MDHTALMTSFWPELILANPGRLAGAFPADARVSYPPSADVSGQEALAQYLEGTHHWLGRQAARWEPLRATIQAARVVHEGLLILRRQGEEIRLPVATVADLDGDRVSWLRIYHSMWPLDGEHALRSPLLPAQPRLLLSGAVALYQDALARGDLEGILQSFDPQGCAREPSGSSYEYCGLPALRRFYASLFSNGGGIGLEHCTVTDDGTCCAIEYNAVRWGRTQMTPQAGVAVYERGADGRLIAARIYDDVDPPIDY